MQLEKTPILSVSELNQHARGILEMHMGKIAVMGEISNFSRPASGHWYFTLKDANAQIRCAMFRNKNQFLRIQPQNGMQVVIHGGVSIYEGRGDYQLIADYLEEAGIGVLQRQFEQLKARLAAEGLFESRHKQPLPRNPQHIGVITSSTGAAIHDILKVLKARFPLLRVTLIPAAVQGEKAAAEICNAIALAERWNTENADSIEVMIVGRGGGSLEDLWPFNEESVARAIFACKIPVISAVGHEVDVTIADYVADLRAPTPSAAAEMISPDQNALKQQLDYHERQLHAHVEKTLEHKRKTLLLLQKGLRHPGERLAFYRLRFRQLEQQLANGCQQQLQATRHRLNLLNQQLGQQHPENLIKTHKATLANSHGQLLKSWQQRLEESRRHLQQQAQLLNTVSPLATLDRGYAIVRDHERHIIRDARLQKPGNTITATLAHGELTCTITHISNEKEKPV